ncbi:Thivi_2564 family membrane protein [Legionella quateirensis]|uniref:Uncharacterized protein n=1 Tax=Legionella quateirensis TaxID=45072 RepID=A0A378KTK3_9GAMM|nr:Thivi_2564 family membrane protein [Legionella quateirensis]KTD50872.1 hypothetical protein Lqua_1099 [Legionella quateirensis]STY17882.1 Uncharacterised protein [Legionella quateirensis]
MFDINQLLMVVIAGLLLWIGNSYIPLPALINLLYNMFLLVVLVLYIMQFLGVVKEVLPSPKIFK